MRKFFIPLLLAGTLIPSMASAQDNDSFFERVRERRAAQQQNSSDDQPRPTRIERSGGDRDGGQDRPRFERRERPGQIESQPAPTETPMPSPVADDDRGPRREVETIRRVDRNGVDRGTIEVRRRDRDGGFERVRRVEEDSQDRGAVEIRRGDRVPTVRSGTSDVGTWDRDRRHGDQSGVAGRVVENPYTTTNHRRWSGDWRRDGRYNWRSYRDRHRSIFRFGRYYDPYGYRYRRFSIGFSIYPSYYRSNYWLDDPWMYRLPPAYGPYRWVRYYDDAVLVNIYTGRVADVIYNFFW